MLKCFKLLRDTIIAGLIFLLPVLIVLVLISRVIKLFEKFTTRLADLVGLKSVIGIPASTIVVMIAFVILCLICGCLVRVVLLKHVSEWLDAKLREQLPGYDALRQKALDKIKKE